MNKKLIAIILVIVIIAVVAVTAVVVVHKKKVDTNPYIENDQYDFVTDKDGNKVYDENGEFYVYVTDENGKRTKDENGKDITGISPFQSFEKDGYVEDYGYALQLPKGWTITDQKGRFENKETGDVFEISPRNDLYENKLAEAKNSVKYVQEADDIKRAEILEGIPFKNEDISRSFCYEIETNGNVIILRYCFETVNNLFVAEYSSNKADTARGIANKIISSIDYKSYPYFENRLVDNTITTSAQSAEGSPAVDPSATEK